MGRFTSGMRTSTRQDWRTPAALFRALDAEFGFTLDAASDGDNALCDAALSVRDDGLGASWIGQTVWLNPPYRWCGQWIRKARLEAARGATVVCLIPARCDTAWWNEDVVPHATEIRFIRGRLRFDDNAGGAPFPSAVVVFQSCGSETTTVTSMRADGTPFKPSPMTLPLEMA